MRIAYCTNVRLPSERAHGHQIAQVCDAIARLGHAVTVFHPFRDNVIEQDYWTYYGADRHVQVRALGSYDFIRSRLTPGVLGLWLMNAMLRNALRQVLPAGEFDLAYTRAPALLPALLDTGIPTVIELHQIPRRNVSAFVRQCNQCRLVVCLTSAMREELRRQGVEDRRMVVEGDAVDLERFRALPPSQEARSAFGLSTDRLVVGYVGRLKTLGMDKGVAVLLHALAHVRQTGRFMGLIVGGPQGDRQEYEALARSLGLTESDVCFTGEIPARNVPAAMVACDILAMPFPDMPHYRTHMSPLKMFEYMAAGRPILTSDLPTIRDVLSEQTAVFCEPGDPVSVVAALDWIAEHPAEAQVRAQAARKVVASHTWEERMRRILGRIDGSSHSHAPTLEAKGTKDSGG